MKCENFSAGQFAMYDKNSCLIIAAHGNMVKILTIFGECVETTLPNISYGLRDDRFEVLDNFFMKQYETGLIVRDIWLLLKLIRTRPNEFYFTKAINVDGLKCEYPKDFEFQLNNTYFVYDELTDRINETIFSVTNFEELKRKKYVYEDKRAAHRAKLVVNKLFKTTFVL